jgi:hypothetical protein
MKDVMAMAGHVPRAGRDETHRELLRGNLLEMYHLKGPAGDDRIRVVNKAKWMGFAQNQALIFCIYNVIGIYALLNYIQK